MFILRYRLIEMTRSQVYIAILSADVRHHRCKCTAYTSEAMQLVMIVMMVNALLKVSMHTLSRFIWLCRIFTTSNRQILFDVRIHQWFHEPYLSECNEINCQGFTIAEDKQNWCQFIASNYNIFNRTHKSMKTNEYLW